MILSPTSTKIQSIYNPDVTYVTTDEPAESVGRIMQKYDLVAIPWLTPSDVLSDESRSTTWLT